MLLTIAVWGHASRLVHRERRGQEQHQRAAADVEEFAGQPAEMRIVRLKW